MQAIALSGGNGFLGWHTRCAIQAGGGSAKVIAMGDAFDLDHARSALSGVDRFIHIAGVNRGTDDEIAQGNERFATQLIESLRGAGELPKQVVFANSIQSTGDSAYGNAKRTAALRLREECARLGIDFADVLLPNLFGEHGRPFYNSVVATFAHLVATGGTPNVENDKSLDLLHVQNAADVLLGAHDDLGIPPALLERRLVSEVLNEIVDMAKEYRSGQIPDVSTDFKRDLFNTYRSFTVPHPMPFQLQRNVDQRGAFVEIIRTHGGPGQSSFSTTAPGVTRGDHFHRRKIERFTVLAGEASIALRRVGGSEVVRFRVSGNEPVALDMPTMWAHNITNVGDSDLFTSFWSNELFDPARPDTYVETV